MADIIQWRRDYSSNWTSVNPVLAQGEVGYEVDANRFKVGDGVSSYNALPYAYAAGAVISAGTNSQQTGTISFADSNGVTFGMNTAGVITASISATGGGGGAGTGFTSATTAGTAIVGTLDTNGLNLAVPQYLTTATHNVIQMGGGNSSGTANTYASGTVQLYAGAGITMSQSSNTITVYGNQGGGVGVSSGGNTAGSTGLVTNQIVFAGGSNVTLSQSTNGGSATISVVGPSLTQYLTTAAQVSHSHGNPTLALTNLTGTTASASNGFTISLSAAAPGGAGDGVNIVQIGTTGTTGTAWSASTGTVQFNGSQNITVSQNNSNQIVIVGPSLTPYLQTSQSSLFQHTSATSAIVSDRAGVNGAITGGSITVNTSGVSINLPAYITTYVNDLTSGRAGTGFTSASTAGTDVVATLNTNGLSMGVPKYITTYVNDLTSGRAGTGFTSASTAGTDIVATLNTNGLSVGVPKYITTYVNDLTSGRAGTGFTSATTAGTAVVGTLNTNGLSVGVPAFITTYQNDLTSGRAGTGFTSTTTAGTAVVGTLNTGGLSIGVPAYITTYQNDLTSGRAGTGTTYAGTNVSASMTLNTDGLNLALSAAAPGGGGTQSVYAVSNTTQSTSGTYTNGLSFAGAGIASVGVSNGSVVVSVPTGGAGDGYNIVSMGSSGNTTGTAWSSLSASIGIYGGNNITISQNNSNQLVISAPSGGGVGVSNLGNTAGSTGAVSDQMVFVGSNGLYMSQSTNGQSATMTVGIDPVGNYAPFPLVTSGSIVFSQNSLSMQHFNVPVPVEMNNIELYGKLTYVSSSNSMSAAATISYGLYSQDVGTNSTRMTLIASSTAQMHGSFNSSTTGSFHYAVGGSTAGTAGNSNVLNSFGANFVHVYFPFATTLQPNVKYALGMLISSATTVGTQALRLSGFMAQTIVNSSFGRLAKTGLVAPVSTVIGDQDMGIYMTSTGAMVNSYATSQISYVASRPKLYMQFDM